MADERTVDAFLELLDEDGQAVVIAGESLDSHFQQAGLHPMELLSFSLEAQRDLTGDKIGGEEEPLFTFSVTKEVDSATPQLFLAFCNCATDQDNPLATARVTLRKAGGPMPLNYLIYDFRELAIKTWKLSCKDGSDLPEEEIEFTFQELLITYTPQTTKGVQGTDLSMGWNFATHEPL